MFLVFFGLFDKALKLTVRILMEYFRQLYKIVKGIESSSEDIDFKCRKPNKN